VAFVAILQTCFYYCNLYDLSAIRHRHEQWISLGQSVGAGCLLLGLLYFVFPSLVIGRGVFFISVVLVAGFVMASRTALDHIWQVAAPKENIVILGTQELAATVARELRQRDDLNVHLLGFVSIGGPESQAGEIGGSPVIGTASELEAIVAEQAVSRIVVALEDRRNALPTRELVRMKVSGVRVEDAHSTISALSGRVWLETIKPSWFVFSDGFRRSAVTLVLKRAIDLSCGVVGLLVSLPVMLLVMLAIRLDSKGPAIFRQTRVGLRGKCFELLKFRSMRADAEARNGAQWASQQDPRVTRVGRFLRKYRLDELPQFVNVIRGDMSFVGPRPERPVFVDQLRKEISYYDERHTVRPGLTGWAQVQYRYGSSVQDAIRKLEYDLFYLKNMSVMFDCAIIFKTIGIVLTGSGSR
jgi:sugar transferase (PEP-CTERM system associated)